MSYGTHPRHVEALWAAPRARSLELGFGSASTLGVGVVRVADSWLAGITLDVGVILRSVAGIYGGITVATQLGGSPAEDRVRYVSWRGGVTAVYHVPRFALRFVLRGGFASSRIDRCQLVIEGSELEEVRSTDRLRQANASISVALHRALIQYAIDLNPVKDFYAHTLTVGIRF